MKYVGYFVAVSLMVLIGVGFHIAQKIQERDAKISSFKGELDRQKAETEKAKTDAQSWHELYRKELNFSSELFAVTHRPPAMPRPSVHGGYLDAADCLSIGGWATNPVDIYDGNELFAKNIPANLYRRDVGEHAFSFSTTARLIDGEYHYVNVRHAGTHILLGTGGRLIRCGAMTDDAVVIGLNVLVRQQGGLWREVPVESAVRK